MPACGSAALGILPDRNDIAARVSRRQLAPNANVLRTNMKPSHVALALLLCLSAACPATAQDTPGATSEIETIEIEDGADIPIDDGTVDDSAKEPPRPAPVKKDAPF